MRVCRSPELFAAYRGLPRLRVPRHPPHAFCRLTPSLVCWVRPSATRRPTGTRGPDPRAKRCTRPRRSHPAPRANRACAPSPPEPATRLRGDLHSIDRSDLADGTRATPRGLANMPWFTSDATRCSRRRPRLPTTPTPAKSHITSRIHFPRSLLPTFRCQTADERRKKTARRAGARRAEINLG